MFDRVFSLAFFLVWVAITLTVIGAVWLLGHEVPPVWFRMAVATLAGLAAQPIEEALARRRARKGRPRRVHAR